VPYANERQIVAIDRKSDSQVSGDGQGLAGGNAQRATPGTKSWILGCPAKDEADEIALHMLAKVVGDERLVVRVLSAEILFSEVLAEAEKTELGILCIGSLPHGATLPVRQLCKRLRARFPTRPILLGYWGARDPSTLYHRMVECVTDCGWTLAETKNLLSQYSQLETVSTGQEDVISDSLRPNSD
jgi:hypothetical protein